MRDSSLRALGASSVLALVAVAALVSSAPPDTRAEIAARETTTSTTAGPSSTTTTTLPPFHYRIGVLAGLQTDNFWAFYGGEPSVWDAYMLGPTKPALYGLDAATSHLAPELAAGMPEPVEEGGWHVDVMLRADRRWSDGVPITTGDYVFTFDTVRAFGLGGGWAEVFPPEITAVEAIDSHQLRISFAERPSLAVWPHAAGTAPVMPAHIWEDADAADAASLYALSETADVGGGTLAISEVSDQKVISVGLMPGTPDFVEYTVYPDMDTAVEALAAGDIDTVLSPNGLLPVHVERLRGVPGVTVETSPAHGIRFLGFNLAREPMSDPAFRQALALLSPGPVIPFVGPHNRAWFDPETAASIASLHTSGDPLAEAVGLLSKAGYTWDAPPARDGDTRVAGTGLRIEGLEAPILTILTPGDSYDPTRSERAAEIASVLGWLGFDCRPVETDFQTVIDLAFTPDDKGDLHYDMAMLGWTLGSPARPDFFGRLFSPAGAGYNTGYESEAFDEALARYVSAVDHAAAKAVLWEMETILATDLPYLLLENTTITEAYRSDRVTFEVTTQGGIQGRLGGVADVARVAD